MNPPQRRTETERSAIGPVLTDEERQLAAVRRLPGSGHCDEGHRGIIGPSAVPPVPEWSKTAASVMFLAPEAATDARSKATPRQL